jgi:hypothetical protein
MSKVEESGKRTKKGGRAKGTPNKTTTLLKEAILKAAELAGEDGKGKGQTIGYLKKLAMEHPPAFAGLLGKVLPLQLAGSDEEGELTELRVRIVRS